MNFQHDSSEIHIKRYENQDLDSVKEFYERSYQGDLGKKLEAFRWISENNPFRDPNNNYVLIFKSRELVGYFGIMPVRFYLNGQSFMAIYGHETLVDPSFRRQGLATALLNEIDHSGSFYIGLWYNENLLRVLQRVGWKSVGHFRPLRKIFKVENLLRLEIRKRINNRIIENVLIELARRYYGLKSEKKYEGEQYRVEAVKRFDGEYDGFFLRVTQNFKLISDRTSQTLNWKYIDIPHRQFHSFCVRKNRILVGYVVLGVEQQENNIKKGIIADLLIDPKENGALESLLEASGNVFIGEGVDFAVCQVSFPLFRTVMRAHGYHQGERGKCDCLLIYNEKYSLDPEVVKDINNWYFTYGDSDYTMW